MLAHILNVVTDLGNSAIIGALTFMLSAYLLKIGQRRAAMAVFLSFAVTAGLIALCKVILYSRCAVVATFFDLKSPSGHSALAMAVYCTMAAILASSRQGIRRFAPFAIAIPLIALIAVSRVVLGFHTKMDVLTGSGVGLIVFLVLWRMLLKDRPIQCPWIPFTIIVLVVLSALYGLNFSAEETINRLADYIRIHFRSC